MGRRLLGYGAVLVLAAAWLTACDGFALTTPLPTAEVSPTSPCPSAGEITKSLATPQPGNVLLELAWEGGLTRPERAFDFGRVPEFTLLPDGSVYYIDPAEWDDAQVMVAHLTQAEVDALAQRVLDLGFERLESYTDACQPQADGTCLCVADAGASVLRVRLPGGELRQISNYATFANDPDALTAIRALLEGYRHPQAGPYLPDKAALFIRPVSPSSDLPLLDWPLQPEWLGGVATGNSCVTVLTGVDLQALLAVTQRNMGDFYFRVAGADQTTSAYLVPWLPGADYTDLIASSGQACAPVELSTTLETLADTEWTLISLNGQNLVEGSCITLAFFPDNYMQGDAGCNTYGVDYKVNGREFLIPEIHRTEEECEVPVQILQQEAAYFDALESVTAYWATENCLAYQNAAGALVLAYDRKLPATVDPALQDTEWILTELHSRDLAEGSRITLNLAQEGFAGLAGCNNYGGEYEQADAGNWTAASVWLTAADCGQPAIMDQEQAFVAALGDAVGYRLADGRLELADASGEAILVFIRKEAFATQPSDLCGTVWRLVSFDGDPPIEGSTITLAFYDENVLGGHAGCRNYVATYDAAGDNLNLVYEVMFDADCSMEDDLLEQEGRFLDSFAPKADIWLGDGSLEIHGERGGLLIFEALPHEAALTLEGPTWSLQTLVEPNPLVEMPEPWLSPNGLLGGTAITLTIESGVARGSAGCNSYTAAVSRDGAALSFEGITLTQQACPDPQGIMEQETHYVDFLGAITGHHIYRDQLWLATGDGRALIFTAP